MSYYPPEPPPERDDWHLCSDCGHYSRVNVQDQACIYQTACEERQTEAYRKARLQAAAHCENEGCWKVRSAMRETQAELVKALEWSKATLERDYGRSSSTIDLALALALARGGK